uniref:Serine aminopeptidase S33 domain-containing protein n=1 Tax=candidate division WOR-3 bacterium TaxID=2052148 RepID=A0A7C4UDQ0_UNCW3
MRNCIILVHGFGGTPYEMKKLGEYLKKYGFSPEYPLLLGHRDKPESLKDVKLEDWKNQLIEFYNEMEKKYEKVFLCGLSMGALLSGIIASIKIPEKLILLAPAVYIKKASFSLAPFGLMVRNKLVRICDKSLNPESYHFAPAFSVYQLLRARNEFVKKIGLVKSPTLIIHGLKDEMVKPLSSIFVFKRLKTKKKISFIEDATHVLTLDNKKEDVFKTILDWVK